MARLLPNPTRTMIAPLTRPQFDRALRAAAQPWNDQDPWPELLELIGGARIVMLGEATHGTSEFYEWRRMISERLVRDHGFNFIAVEGDWPDCQRVHEHITLGRGAPREALAGYRRFPTWMWGNDEVLELVEWLRGYNESLRETRGARRAASPSRQPIGFHGLDVYSLHDSMKIVVDYLRRIDPPAAEAARRAYACFDPYADPQDYAYATRFVAADCEAQVIAALTHIERQARLYRQLNPDHVDPGEAYFDAVMNARIARNAEAYYRTMLRGEAPSWNVRDRHMMETLTLLLDHYGHDSRAVIWAHNTHIGDYRATDMRRAGYVNIGGLAREGTSFAEHREWGPQFGRDSVRLIGFGTHRGTVIAAREWGAAHQVMQVPPAMPGSLEDRLHAINMPQLWIPLAGQPEDARHALNETIGHRAIGVVYQPEYERPGQYVPTRLADRYDAFIFIDETQAVHPLDIAADLAEEPEAWPSGL